MPSYKGHLLGGLVVYSIALLFMATTLSWLTKGEWLLCTLFGALFPDIDIKSKGQKLFYALLLVIGSFFIKSDQKTTRLSSPGMNGHRTSRSNEKMNYF
ncbi:MAG: hypothetical protein WA432_00805 [Candidatus Babeliaceae bacterium]